MGKDIYDSVEQQYCIDCGAPMRMEKVIEEYSNKTGKPKYSWMCYCPNNPTGISRLFTKLHRSPIKMFYREWEKCWVSCPGYDY
jgi:hypothetical protein